LFTNLIGITLRKMKIFKSEKTKLPSSS